jgi:hypothetical protein
VRSIYVSLLLALALPALILLTGRADAYVVQGHPWPGGVIRYYNGAPDQAWAVKRAVDAWNASGAKVRLVAAPSSQANVRIEHFARASCTVNAEATVGYTYTARIWIFRRDQSSPYCNSYVAAQALVHEFGHVLGLGHETRGCATMNPVGTLQGPSLCPKARRWQWRCRLLTTDDVTGAVALYGGTVASQRRPTDCDLYSAIAAPAALRVQSTPASHTFRLTFRRPRSVAVPSLLTAGHRLAESYVAGAARGSCPTDAYAFPIRGWNAAVGGTEQTYLSLPGGVSCVAVWALDSFGRPSTNPAMLRIRVVEAG